MAPALIPLIATAALTAVNGMVQARQTAKAARAELNAAAANAAEQIEQVNAQASEAKGDRAAEADRELATLQVMASERGGLGTNTFARQVRTLKYTATTDLQRVEGNRSRAVRSIRRGVQRAGEAAKMRVKHARTSAVLGVAGAAAKIGAGAYAQGVNTTIQNNFSPSDI